MFTTGFPRPTKDTTAANFIKTQQNGQVTSAAGSPTTLSVLISAVDPNKSVLIVTQRTASGTASAAYDVTVRGKIDSPTSITFTRSNTAYVPLDISWQVIEFQSAKSIQRGDYTLSTSASVTSGTQTISAVNPAKSLVFFSFYSNYNGNQVSAMLVEAFLSNSTTLTFAAGIFTTTYPISWQVVECF